MILLGILAVIMLLVMITAVLILSVGGTIGVVLFSDLIVCVAVIYFIMRAISRRRKNKKKR